MSVPNTPSSVNSATYLLSLTVENFRCFKQKVILDLADSKGKPTMWNVILGENGVGKTTLLQLLASARPNVNQILKAIARAVAIENRYPENKDSITWDLPMIPFMLDLFHRATATESLEKMTNLQIRAWHSDTNKESLFDFFSQHRSTRYEAENDFYFNFRCFAYGSTRRMSKKSVLSTLQEDSCASLFDDSTELINAEEWLLQADYASKTAKEAAKERAEKRLIQSIDLIRGVLPNGGVKDIRFDLDEKTAVATPRVEAQTPYGWVRLRDLSLGYQVSLTWMLDLAARMLERYPDSPDPLAEPAVVLVDEIDLHLHPKWQRELIQKLTETFPKTQFIVTAHSPLIVQAAPNANIALLKRVGDHVEIDNDVDHIRNWRADQILTSDLFGLESARPPHLDAAFREREELLTKPELTDADWKRLDELSEQIGETNEGERTGDMEAQNLIRRAAQLLQKQ